MNKIIESLYSRKSVRAFTNQEISPEIKEKLLQATVQAPTAGNMMLYSIIDVTDSTLKESLAKSCDNQPFIATAPLVFIFIADHTRWHRGFEIAKANPRKVEAGDLFLSITDTAIAAQNMVVAAEALGLGSCYIGDILEQCELIRALLNLPEQSVPVCMLVLGYPTEQQKSRSKPARFDINYIVGKNSYPYLEDAELIDCYNERVSSATSFNEYMQAFCKRKFNSDFSIEMNRSVKEYLKAYHEDVASSCDKVFVYGTLMKGYYNHDNYLAEATYLGERVLDDYELYDLGVYPAIVSKEGEKVKGELYKIDDYLLNEMDILEDEGTLYKRIIVEVYTEDGLNKEKAYAYVYNKDITKYIQVPFSNQPWKKVTQQQLSEEYVWYASYGSNMLYERFLYYIQGGSFNQKIYVGCRNTQLPLKDETILIPYPVYFGNSAPTWEDMGVAFLDTSLVGITLGRMYLITKEQFEDVWEQEGKHENWYNKKVCLGKKYGIEIVTFTNEGRRMSNPPSKAYLDVIRRGVLEVYPNCNIIK